MSYYTQYAKNLTVLGIAKDGHIIVGPYDSNGNYYDCTKLDTCYGTYLSDGSYIYIYNDKFPYGVNCFGPGVANTYSASCSTNDCSLSAASNSKILKFGLFMVSAIFGLMI